MLLLDENTVTDWKKRYLERKNVTSWLFHECKGYSGKLSKSELESPYQINKKKHDKKSIAQKKYYCYKIRTDNTSFTNKTRDFIYDQKQPNRILQNVQKIFSPSF